MGKDGNLNYGVMAGRTAAAAVVGGTVAAATGGNFIDGARTGAYGELYNYFADVLEDVAEKLDDVGNALMPLDGAGMVPKAAAEGIKEGIAGAEAAEKAVVVIGETMTRVEKYAEELRTVGFKVKTYSPRNFRSFKRIINRLDLEANRSWLRYNTLGKGYLVHDIGLDSTRLLRSDFYAMENKSIYENWNYQNVQKIDPGF